MSGRKPHFFPILCQNYLVNPIAIAIDIPPRIHMPQNHFYHLFPLLKKPPWIVLPVKKIQGGPFDPLF